MRLRAASVLLALLIAIVPGRVAAQSAGTPRPELRVFVDCRNVQCDRDFLYTDIAFVEFTRDPNDADVHALVTGLANGAGGQRVTAQFVGRGAFLERSDTLTATLAPDASADDRRRVLAHLLKLGLVRFAANTAVASRLHVQYDAPADAKALTLTDPWDSWIFDVRGNGSFGSESQSKRSSVALATSARRVTDALKFGVGISGSYREAKYTFDDGTSSTFALRSWGGNARVVRSVTDHWSLGATGTAGHSEYNNQDMYARVQGSAEYNIFPWKDATDQQLVLVYAVGAASYRYQEETIFGQMQETHPLHQFIAASRVREPWGSIDASASFSQYLHDMSKQNLGGFASTNVRLTRGLSLNLTGSASIVHDQLYIAAGGLTPEQILTSQRSQATTYQFSGYVGLSYTFGSLLNSVVNPRLDALGGGGGQTFFFF
ncbi:MAG: hypothetical protein HYR75_10335 [Gemmatimonadetes bacterium]|nr:hypothetical protein [Gemmatimonadota bacterium]